MNTAEYVDQQIEILKNGGIPLTDAAWQAALLCVGWPYVFGAWGEQCTPANRRKRYSSSHPTIKSKCKNFDGTGKCTGCQWFPDGKRVRQYDCRGFVAWLIEQIYGFKLAGEGATSQWNTASNWKAKGTIDSIPDGTLVCVFVANGNKMEHVGLAYKGETVECSSGVQHFTTRKAKWTHWAQPVCVEGGVTPVPVPTGYAEVTGKRVALRTAPTTQASIIMRIDTGRKVKLETPPPEEWDYVSYDGKKGWMMKKFLKEGD